MTRLNDVIEAYLEQVKQPEFDFQKFISTLDEQQIGFFASYLKLRDGLSDEEREFIKDKKGLEDYFRDMGITFL